MACTVVLLIVAVVVVGPLAAKEIVERPSYDVDVDDLPINNTELEEEKEIQDEKQGGDCRITLPCAIAGGSCVTNPNDCYGSLVSNGCGGKLCQCCIPGCPDEPGFLLITTPVKKCYHAFSDITRNWFETKDLCALYGWKMVHPADVLSLRSVAIQTFGYHHAWLWLGGRGTGSSFEWNDGINIRNDDPLWMIGDPRSTSTDHCLGMAANWHDSLDRTYAAWPCTWRGPGADVYAFCEVPM